MDGDRWVAVALLVGVAVMTALFHYMAVSGDIRDLHRKVDNDNRDLRYEIGDLRRDVGEVKREIEFRAEQDDWDVQRILSDLRRSR